MCGIGVNGQFENASELWGGPPGPVTHRYISNTRNPTSTPISSHSIIIIVPSAYPYKYLLNDTVQSFHI